MTMETLSDEFHKRPEYQKLIMGKLAFGNSPYDLLKMVMDRLTDEEVGQFLTDLGREQADQDKEPETDRYDVKKLYLEAYDHLGESINSPVVG